MRFLITGVKNGKSCVTEEIDCTQTDGDMTVKTLLDLPIASLPPRPAGKGGFIDLEISPGTVRWLRVRFSPHMNAPVHHTDSIDCMTVVAGSVDLILDDGAHRLVPGDSAMVKGVDHGWRTGAEECLITTLIFGTPAPANGT